ncbi:hypothetical protein [Salinispora oceanensis]|uniref:hypothetical protein n=1 Tax=Salinispora oceanensis TaxID=1050199 RepID=UPI0003689668|nr:hypothetical protein [Salinispora oceanensis]
MAEREIPVGFDDDPEAKQIASENASRMGERLAELVMTALNKQLERAFFLVALAGPARPSPAGHPRPVRYREGGCSAR